MLMVPTELRNSSIQGVGVFLLASVKKGELVWQFDSRIDRVYMPAELELLPEPVRDFVKIHAYWNKSSGLWVLCGDNAKYYNHSDTPTTVGAGNGFAGVDLAAADLLAGTEITSDYRTFHDIPADIEEFAASKGSA